MPERSAIPWLLDSDAHRPYHRQTSRTMDYAFRSSEGVVYINGPIVDSMIGLMTHYGGSVGRVS